MSLSSRSLGLSLALLLTGAAGCATDDDGGGGASLTIDNESSYSFIEINISPVNQTSWGSDLLGADILDPGDSFLVSEIDCDVYDIRLIDEDSDECVLTDIDLCFDNAVWQIDDAELAACVF
jgi:hypothetical protein